jgi:alpha-galactosidase
MNRIFWGGIFFLIYTPFAFSDEAPRDIITVSTDNLSMVFTVSDKGKVFYHYFGEKLNDYSGFAGRRHANRPDTPEELASEIYPAYGGRYYTEPALQITHADGLLTTDLVYSRHNSENIDGNITETVIELKDKLYPVTVGIHLKAYQKENVICQSVSVTNDGNKKIRLSRFYSAYLPLQKRSYYLTHFHGTWAAEMQMVEEQLLPGIKKIESKKGVRTTQSENPSFLLSVNSPATEDSGEVYAGSLAWSGNYVLSFELDEAGILNVLGGANPFLSEYSLASGQAFSTPEMVLTYSNTGKGQISRNYHDWSRKYAMAHGDRIHPVVLNSWEGAYFSFNENTITGMIDKAAEFGIEMFVLDDGWFGNKYPRNGDNAGLGDWQTNMEKLPRGIDYLAKYAHNKGLKFGIWIEPEMVNPDSELARKHPEWIVKSGKREILTMRNQWLLDLSNPRVQDFIVKTFDDVVTLSPYISYIKWDANRHVDNVGSEYLPADNQTHFWIDYTRGLYSVYERIRDKHPDISIQLCSSGGGRLDFGALKYHDEYWASDNTSPLNRIFIQYGANLFFPAIATASHVSTAPNHQTGAMTPLKFRFDVAMSGRLGMEMQPKDIEGDEIEFTREAIRNYKLIRPVVQFGDLYRLVSPYDGSGWASHMYVAKDKRQAVVFAYSLKYHNRTMSLEAKMNGLDPGKMYRITELNKKYGSVLDHNDTFTGEFLMRAGLNLNIRNPYESMILLVTEL